MRYTFIFMLLPVSVFTQNIKLDEKNGFMNYKFGSTPNEYKGLYIELDENNSKLYSVTGPLIADSIEYEYIRLTFTKNKLTAISLKTKNSNGQKLFNKMKTTFGDPKLILKTKNYEWLGNKVQLIYSIINSEGVSDFYSLNALTKYKK